MYKVELKNLDNVVSWVAKFPTYQEALAWTNQQLLKPNRLQGDPDDFIQDITTQYNAEENKKQKIIEGAKARQACQNVLDLVAGYNLDNELTAEQITSMQTTFSSIFQLLLANRPSSAKSLISAIEPDGVIVTSQMKQDCLDLLANY